MGKGANDDGPSVEINMASMLGLVGWDSALSALGNVTKPGDDVYNLRLVCGALWQAVSAQGRVIPLLVKLIEILRTDFRGKEMMDEVLKDLGEIRGKLKGIASELDVHFKKG